nr:FlgD immunoglobulin-like domain containing protein [Polynucleobacter sp. 30F-ANTBAC]
MAPSSNINYDGSTPVNLAAKLASDASNVSATITNELGQKILEVDLGAANEGVVNFSWDGSDAAGNPVAAGMYKLLIASTTTDGKEEKPTAYVSSRVATIGKNGTAIEVNLADGRTLTPSEIAQWVA